MTARLAATIGAVLAVALSAGAPASAANLELAPAGKPRFPVRTFALTLPAELSLSSQEVTVRENGRIVPDASVVSGTATSQLGVVLVMDASNSMRGEAIAGATVAARTLANHRNRRQPLGIVTFNDEAATLLSPTTDETEIDSALSSPPALARGTHIYDAVDVAIALFEEEGISGGSVVVLSDGSDTGSGQTVTDVTATAREAGVRIHAVGLRSPAFEPDPLQDLATGAGGSYSEASSPAELQQIYDELGAQLASQYLVRYRSSAGPEQRVDVAVKVAGVPGLATAEYTTPGLGVGAAPPFRRSAEETFWRSKTTVVAVSLLVGALLGLALALLFRPSSRSRTLRDRIDAYAPGPGAGEHAGISVAALTDRILMSTERSLERRSWWPAAKQTIETARIPLTPVQVVVLTAVGTVVVAWMLAVVVGNPLAALGGLLTPLVVRSFIRFKFRRECNKFDDQLPDHLSVIASAMRAGHSFVGALSVADEDAPQPVRREFDRAIADERLGVPIEDALDAVGDRMQSEDMVHVALVAKLQRKTGANSAEVLDRVAATLRERQELRRYIRVLTAQQRMARVILTAIPVLLILILSAANPEYMAPLWEESSGRVLLAIGIFGIVFGSYMLKRLVDIKV
jgi:tight adherence protein B